MKSEFLLDAIGSISDELVENAGKPRRIHRARWGALTACLCLAAAGALLAVRSGLLPGSSTEVLPEEEPPPVTEEGAPLAPDTETDGDTEVVFEEVAHGFRLNGCIYYPISFEERIRFGLLPEEAVGLDGEDGYLIMEYKEDGTLKSVPYDLSVTEADLGEPMGYAEGSADSGLNGCAVYHHADYPDYTALCIVETQDGYQLFSSDGYELLNDKTETFDRVLDAYGMPHMVETMEILTGDWAVLETTSDQGRIAAVCSLLTGKENMGLQAHEERYAALWKETYGNEDVYLHENGSMIYKNDTLHDQAHALWHENERLIRFTTTDGFRFYVDYHPSILSFSGYGYYALTEAETAELNALLDIA